MERILVLPEGYEVKTHSHYDRMPSFEEQIGFLGSDTEKEAEMVAKEDKAYSGSAGQFIKAAHNFFTECKEYDFRFHRLQRVKNTIQAVTFDQDALQTTPEEGWEIR